MFQLNLHLSNPWSKQKFNHLFCKTVQITKHKFFEFETYYTSEEIIGGYLHITTRCDHAGCSLGLTLFGLCVSIQLYDHRHWDIDNNKYEGEK